MNEHRASVDDIDLGRHAVVEASAGTGKTHTIENLVRRLLTEEDVTLEQILIVTFTEKATGELKVRVRRTLERELKKHDEHAAALKHAVDHFDQAPVFTIHGFCQRMLQEYALEQGQDFRTELVSDPDLLEHLLREIQRKDWRREFGARLKNVLERAGYNRDTADDWDRAVLEIARRFKPRSGHRLRPEYRPDWWRRADADEDAFGQLQLFTIDALHRHLRDAKRQRGQLSFDDMIAAVEESLDVEKNPDAKNFLSTLRGRYRYGIVDEFQDTDPLQWRIFRRIFCEGGGSKLLIVGDPKQAIFGFRGADLPTYQRAAGEMTAEFGAADYPLTVNWRSDPDLLEALNCVFADGGWFPKTSGIRYHHVYPPDDDQRQSRIEDDQTQRAALTLVDLTHNDRIKLAQRNYGRFIAHEIHRLLGGGRPLLSFALKNAPPRPLDASDICILVMKRTDAEPITPALDEAGIPYSFYKQAGLWYSEEAAHLQTLLHALAHADDRASFRKALFTCFFGVKPEELAAAPDVPMQHPASRLWQTWLGCVDNRQWSALFRSMLEDTGLLFLSPDDPGADRRLANLRQMLATLEQVGHGLNLDLSGLLDWLRDKGQQRDTGEPEMQPDEAGRPKVKIMTIHAAKGLEFPVVFLGGGFTTKRDASSVKVYHDKEGHLVFDLTADDQSAGRVAIEADSEHRRLLYVALTRPIFKLYVPKVRIPARTGNWLGPVATILLPALEQACPDKLGPLIAEVVKPPLNLGVEKDAPAAAPVAPKAPEIALQGPLFPRIDSSLGKRRVVVRSFSSLARHHLSSVGDGSSFGEQTPLAFDEAPAQPDQDDPLRGPVFGDMVHNVLEHIDFAEVARAASPAALAQAGTHARKRIDHEIKANIANLRARTPGAPLEDVCRQQIATLVWHALTTPLAELGEPLCAIDKRDRLHEVDFLFPDHSGHPPSARERGEDAFVTGFMDLLFRHRDRYYLLDWKTNLLPAYTREQVERSMADSDYHRQYRLYLHAARRWLERMHGPKFRFFERFAGVYYLFVRGMNGRDEATGVYFHRPTEAELDLASIVT